MSDSAVLNATHQAFANAPGTQALLVEEELVKLGLQWK